VSEPLSRLDIAALRKADSVVFRQSFDRTGEIVAIKEPTQTQRERDPFAQEVRHRIAVGSHVHTYGRESGARHSAFEMIQNADYAPAWTTIAGLLRVGDIVSLSWLRGNQTESLNGAGMVRDELRLAVKRGERGRFVFLVSVRVGPDNSARMTKVD
jgi:hypothetical protein